MLPGCYHYKRPQYNIPAQIYQMHYLLAHHRTVTAIVEETFMAHINVEERKAPTWLYLVVGLGVIAVIWWIMSQLAIGSSVTAGRQPTAELRNLHSGTTHAYA